jgi:hypothetical protein
MYTIKGGIMDTEKKETNIYDVCPMCGEIVKTVVYELGESCSGRGDQITHEFIECTGTGCPYMVDNEFKYPHKEICELVAYLRSQIKDES